MIRGIDLAAVEVVVERAALRSRRACVAEKSREYDCSVTQYMKKCSDFECVAVLLLYIFLGFASKLGREKWLFNFCKTLLGSAEVLGQRNRYRREEKNHSEFLRCCAFLADTWLCFSEQFFQESVCSIGKYWIYLKESIVLQRVRCG